MTDASVLAGQILRDAGDEWDLDEAAESIAVRYVRHLEARCTLAGAGPSPHATPIGLGHARHLHQDQRRAPRPRRPRSGYRPVGEAAGRRR